MIDQTMSLYIPRVFGDDDEQIKREISEQMASQGVGVTSSVDVDHSPRGHKQAFVHFSEWLETEDNEALQTDIRHRHRSVVTAAWGPPPSISDGKTGYWILKENMSAQKHAPNPRPAVDQDTLMLQAKTIRDLREELAQAKGQLVMSAVNGGAQSASSQARAWAKERERKREAGEQESDLHELDASVRRMWRIPSRSQPGVFRTVKWMFDGSWECDCPATTECWHIKQCKLEVAGAIEAESTSASVREAWEKRVAQLERERAFTEGQRDEAQRELAGARAEIEDLQDEVASLKALARLAPPPPLKRHLPLAADAEDYDGMRAQWEREGLEGETGRVPALDRFRGSEFVGAGGGPRESADATAERMALQSEAFRAAMADGSAESPEWSEQGAPNEMLVDERGLTLSAADVAAMDSELEAWRRSRNANGGLGSGPSLAGRSAL
tara:strand:+ start:1658 stop:2980 length:1323 start_codon:yes stop_codon:yes gene_type:complete